MKYNVTFTQYYSYMVEAENEEEAEDLARKKFYNDMCTPIARTWEDELDIEEMEED